jgi:hypothetical protein
MKDLECPECFESSSVEDWNHASITNRLDSGEPLPEDFDIRIDPKELEIIACPKCGQDFELVDVTDHNSIIWYLI